MVHDEDCQFTFDESSPSSECQSLSMPRILSKYVSSLVRSPIKGLQPLHSHRLILKGTLCEWMRLVKTRLKRNHEVKKNTTSHLSKRKNDLKQKCTQLLTPGTVFRALSHGVNHFVRNVSFKRAWKTVPENYEIELVYIFVWSHSRLWKDVT